VGRFKPIAACRPCGSCQTGRAGTVPSPKFRDISSTQGCRASLSWSILYGGRAPPFGVADRERGSYYSYFSTGNPARATRRRWPGGAAGRIMRFHLVDRIIAVEPGKSIRAVKHLTLAEEYLADHFPSFPVMPGVLQLQTLVEAATWLIRLSDEYSRSVWVLRETRNVKYGAFVAPGNRLEVTLELIKREGDIATFRGRGEVDGTQTVSAQLVLAGYNLRDRLPTGADRDERLVRHLQSQADLLLGELVSPSAA
jgi:3-hydroxyacyl-[acyl-carrier-protein] dehydratase